MVSPSAVRTALIAAVADSRATTVNEIEEAIATAGGDEEAQLRSKFAEAVIARLEIVFGTDLPGPADLQRTQFATVGALLAVLVPILAKV